MFPIAFILFRGRSPVKIFENFLDFCPRDFPHGIPSELCRDISWGNPLETFWEMPGANYENPQKILRYFPEGCPWECLVGSANPCP
jgi:hypothetical protein